MILKGKTEEALYYALLASSAGGLFGAFMHLFFYQPLFSLGLKFGRESLFWMGILDLTPISAMFPGHVARSLAAGLIGLGLSTVELDPGGASAFHLRPLSPGAEPRHGRSHNRLLLQMADALHSRRLCRPHQTP